MYIKNMYKQIIVARKDLKMSVGKLAAQISHASMAFLTNMIKHNAIIFEFEVDEKTGIQRVITNPNSYRVSFDIERNLYNQWICGEFTKCILEAKNKNQLLKAKKMAEKLGMKEGIDFFLIKDNCHTELEPEEDGRTLTCIGFRPIDSEIIDKIGKKYQLYK